MNAMLCLNYERCAEINRVEDLVRCFVLNVYDVVKRDLCHRSRF